jgi:arginase
LTRARLLLVPTGAGANEPGLLEGPAAIASLLDTCKLSVETITPPLEREFDLAHPEHDEYARLHHLLEARALADVVAPRVAASLAAGERPVVVGGDHTVAIGSFAGLRLAYGARHRIGIVWVDAHPDLNTPETTPSNHGHGMPLSALIGLGHPVLVNAGGVRGAKLTPGDVALVGIRDIDPGEARLIERHPELHAITAAQIRKLGLRHALDPVLAWGSALEALHLSFDLDAVDPADAPGVTTPVPGGLTAAEARDVVALIRANAPLRSADVVEHLPMRDQDSRTAHLAADLIEALIA